MKHSFAFGFACLIALSACIVQGPSTRSSAVSTDGPVLSMDALPINLDLKADSGVLGDGGQGGPDGAVVRDAGLPDLPLILDAGPPGDLGLARDAGPGIDLPIPPPSDLGTPVRDLNTSVRDIGSWPRLPDGAPPADAGVTEPTAPTCGNGVVDPGESCDPGLGDACGPDCRWSACNEPYPGYYAEDTYPLMACVAPGGQVMPCDQSFYARHQPTQPWQCFDCRGHAADCSRIARGGRYAQASNALFANNNNDTQAGKACIAYASQQDEAASKAAGNPWSSAFRFGSQWSTKAFKANPNDPSKFCWPLDEVNCAGWNKTNNTTAKVPQNPAKPDTAKDEYAAPYGCYCFTNFDDKDNKRSWAQCNDGAMFACPWASGAGCGLYVGWWGGATVASNIRCRRGGGQAAPQYMNCHVDISGMRHDLCCAEQYYVNAKQAPEDTVYWKMDRTAVPIVKGGGLGRGQVECNGCRGGDESVLYQCSDKLSNVSSYWNKKFPCYAEWEMATYHSTSEEYMWRKIIDTENRLTPQQVVDWKGFDGPVLTANWPALRAPKGQKLLSTSRSKGVPNLDPMANVAGYCENGVVNLYRTTLSCTAK